MGIIKRGILGGFSGKVGSVTGSSWKGIEVIKSRPLSVANPRSSGQVAQRSRLSNVVSFAVVINASVLKPLWDRFSVRQSGYNAFVQSNIALFDGVVPSPVSSFVIANGKMEATAISNVTSAVFGTSMRISWVVDSGIGFKLPTDEAYCVFVPADGAAITYSAASAVRGAGSIVVPVNTNVYGYVVGTAYLAFRRADGTIVSKTAFEHVDLEN